MVTKEGIMGFRDLSKRNTTVNEAWQRAGERNGGTAYEENKKGNASAPREARFGSKKSLKKFFVIWYTMIII